MKKTYLLIALLLFAALNMNAQKPKKTFNHEVFAEKFTKFTRGNIIALFGYDNEMGYISSKTGQSVADLNKAKTVAYARIKEEISLTKKQALLMVYDKVELSITQESPIKKADMKIFVHSGALKYTFTLKNCTQTDRTWVLGNDALAEGEMFDSGEAVEENSGTEQATNSKGPYKGFLKFNKELVGKPLKGYYITNDGKKVNAVILNDNPNNLHNNDVPLSLYLNELGNKHVKYDESNFHKNVSKNDLKAFFVAKHLYIKAGSSWFILLEEAAISRLAKISSSTVYKTAASVEKVGLVGKPVRGYYITNDGTKVEAVIKYQETTKLQNMNSTFLLYNIAYNEDGFTEDETNNFKTILMKDKVKEFQLAGNTYYKTASSQLKPGGEWRVKDGGTSYSTGKYVYKIGKEPKEESLLVLGFKKSMSKLTADNSELSTKIADKEKGYRFSNMNKIITEYNTWYEKQYPGKFKYVLASAEKIAEELVVEEIVEEVVEEKENFDITAFGMNLIMSLKKASPDAFIIYNMSTRDLIESFEHYTKDEDMKNGMIERMKKKESSWEAEITKYFNNIKKDTRITNWNDIKFVSAKFEKQSISDEFNFVWGKAVITFSFNGKNFELVANEMAQLYSGWRVNNVILR